MLNDVIASMSLVEYVDFVINTAKLNDKFNPHGVNWEYCRYHRVISEDRYEEAIHALVDKGYESWQE